MKYTPFEIDYYRLAQQINAVNILLKAFHDRTVKFPAKYDTLISVCELRNELWDKMNTLLERI